MKIIDNIKKNTIILLLITVVVLYFVLKDDLNDIIIAFKNIDLRFVFAAVVILFIAIFLRAYVNYLIVDDKEKVSLKESMKHNLITQFFNGITPFSTGGQPMEVYMLTEHNISVAKATIQTIQSFIYYQIALVLCGLFAVLYNFFFHVFPKDDFLRYLVLFGFIINVGIVIILFIIMYSKRVTNKMAKLLVKVAKKIKWKISEEEINLKFKEYYEGAQVLRKRKRLTVIGISFNIISLLCLYSIPLLVLLSMHEYTSMNIFETISASAYVYLIGGMIPIPGASGGVEFTFSNFFGILIPKQVLAACLLVWRFITYYFCMIIGGLVFSLEKKGEK